MRSLVFASLLAALAVAPGTAAGQMRSGMSPADSGSMGMRAAPAPASREPTMPEDPSLAAARTAASAPSSRPSRIEQATSARWSGQNRLFLALAFLSGVAAAIGAYRSVRRRRRGRAAPSAFVTEAVFVIDVVGSTHIATQYGEVVAMRARTAIRDRVMAVASAHGLRFSESTGDGCLASFGSVPSAVATARTVLHDLRAHPPDLAPAPPLAVRMGIAWGEILLDRRGRRHGAVINKAFRIESVRREDFVTMQGEESPPSVAERNRILLDEPAAEEARIAGVGVREVGFARLKGFPGLHRVCEVAA